MTKPFMTYDSSGHPESFLAVTPPAVQTLKSHGYGQFGPFGGHG